jgi:hypothetical protein
MARRALGPVRAPRGAFAVLHVGASTPLKLWHAGALACDRTRLAARGLEPVWSGGRGEEPLVAAADPERRWRSYAGTLDLAQMRALLDRAALLVSPTPASRTWRASPARRRSRSTAPVPRRSPAPTVFTRRSRGARSASTRSVPRPAHPVPPRDRVGAPVRAHDRECARPRCMDAIDVEAVSSAVGESARAADPRVAVPR